MKKELSSQDRVNLLDLDLDEKSWNEETVEAEIQNENYDCDYAAVSGFDLNRTLSTDPLTKLSQQWSSEEKRRKMAEYRDIRCSPQATKAEKDKAYYDALCLIYPYCRSLLRRFCSGHFNATVAPEDYMQTVFMVVAAELENYDETLSIFQYFQLRIKHELIIQVAASQSVTRYYNAQMTKIKRVCVDITKQGRIPTVSDIAYILPEIPFKTIQKCLDILDANRVWYEYAQLVCAGEGNPEGQFLEEEDSRIVREAIKRVLTEQEKEVICYTYGIGSYPELTKEKMANRLGISTDQIRKIKISAEKRLRKELEKSGFSDSAERHSRNTEKIRAAGTIAFFPLTEESNVWEEDEDFGKGFQVN